MEPPWEESLDVDDSDLPSILRPCKRRQTHQSPSHFFTLQSDSSGNAQTLVDSQRPLPVAAPFHPPRSIPGPAGTILAALRRRSEILETESEEEMTVLSTQEYLRKAVDGNVGNSEFDDDFKKSCWVSALDFSVRETGELSSSATVPLGSIKNCGAQKLPKVVAMIKTCTPNGFGDFMVTLKDPSGTISASIHRSVVIEVNHGSDLSVGAVLVLQKVSIFAPRAEYYLNIVAKNVVKIFPKDNVSLSNAGSGLEAITGCRVSASVAKLPMAHDSSSVGIQLTSGGSNNPIDGASNFRVNKQLDRNNSTKDATSKSVGDIEKEINPAGGTTILDSYSNTNNKTQAAVMDCNYQSTSRNEQAGEANIMTHKASAVAVSRASNQMQSLASLSSLPEWTDEQLEALLVDD
ncbi:unnamed protein product [Rhodiola kirilowii]